METGKIGIGKTNKQANKLGKREKEKKLFNMRYKTSYFDSQNDSSISAVFFTNGTVAFGENFSSVKERLTEGQTNQQSDL